MVVMTAAGYNWLPIEGNLAWCQPSGKQYWLGIISC